MTPLFDLTGRIALITGAQRGLGLEIARGLAQAGALVVLNGRRPDALEKARGALAGEGLQVDSACFDVTDRAAVQRAIEVIEGTHGALDILVNNAGIQHVARVQDFPAEKWEAIIAINLSAAFYATKAALPQMLDRNWGRIINIASAHGLVASADKSAYVAAKHGLVGLTKVVALETARTGVTCNAICPGWVLTPLVQKQIDDRAAREGMPVEQAKLELLGEKQPSLEFVTPEQLAGLAVFLCSPAADQVRGQALAMDGGWTAQ